jgi:hypothetical protein
LLSTTRTRSIELLEEWLSRARHQPLTIYLDCEDETRARMLVDVVKPYCLQWQDIHFSLPMSALRQLNTCIFSCLERLTLSSTDSEPLAMTDPVIMWDAPLLREAIISDIPYLQVNLPLERLAILHVADMDLPQIITVLRCCPNLVDLICSRTGRRSRCRAYASRAARSTLINEPQRRNPELANTPASGAAPNGGNLRHPGCD